MSTIECSVSIGCEGIQSEAANISSLKDQKKDTSNGQHNQNAKLNGVVVNGIKQNHLSEKTENNSHDVTQHTQIIEEHVVQKPKKSKGKKRKPVEIDSQKQSASATCSNLPDDFDLVSLIHTKYKDEVEEMAEDLSNLSIKGGESSAAAAVAEEPNCLNPKIEYVAYESELQMPLIMKIIQKDLSEPYSIYTYRYFIHNWPNLCFLAMCQNECVGAIVCKLDMHRKVIKRGYIAMLAVDKRYRKQGLGSTLVKKAIQEMIAGEADEVVLETEITNKPALRLYEALGFVRDKRLFRYYLNGVDALRLKLWLR